MNEQPGYLAVIPAYVRYDKDLTDKAKLLYGELVALANKHGFCFASNNYFAKLYNCSDRTIRQCISSLSTKGYITIQIFDNTERKIYITPEKNFLPTPEKNFLHNSSSNKRKKDYNYYNNTELEKIFEDLEITIHPLMSEEQKKMFLFFQDTIKEMNVHCRLAKYISSLTFNDIIKSYNVYADYEMNHTIKNKVAYFRKVIMQQTFKQ